ncbi:putative toll-like receptor, P-loop containing nucleoside triphosphate hydrolase [Rosa chinensis]|uniref:Putative toll-like receptor, P-loop containing nucleoside triphosphate hydrolase n=1 Tax=Rosa chinensis TaxID=74649 RepID=A0A2P6QMJ8_ROSCH|nr:putative toll-like receptor, P-loop containing nucleoside triphosphate hydrolase [Rosa chinensis]
MAASSSSSSSGGHRKYDVFLSFRGPDTRQVFVGHLYRALQKKAIDTFIDIIDPGKGSIIYKLLNLIDESRISVVVLSENYAFSTSCLKELVKIMECMDKKKQIVVPIFYKVDPFDIRYLKNSFAKAFARHEHMGRSSNKELETWKTALKRITDLSGWDSRKYEDDAVLVEVIVKFVCSKLQPVVEIEATRQATIEIEPTMSESNEDFEVVKVIRRAPTEIEPTMPKLTEDFEGVESTTQATNGNSEPAPQWNHDVFLSFRGDDTRKGFLSHLYHELQNTKVIRTFKDDEQLKKGKDISQSLLRAIEESRFAIVVLSENYAFSAWCLDELTKIFQCMEGKDTILPIFYHADPSDVRYQKGQFEVAFTKHESKARYDIEKVKQWRADLTKVGNLSGWDSKNHKSERELVEDIVKFVLKEVLQAPSGDFEEFEATREAMDEVKKMLKDDKITAIGVYGRGGVGKTAMVKHVGAQAKRIGLFDHVVMAVISQNPDLQKIQGALVNQLGLELVEDEEIEIANLSSIGIPSYDELQRCNSKVLLTTRIMDICHSMECQAHVLLNILSEQDSLKLFMKKSRKPFHGSTDSYDEERNVVRKCSGLPSVLEEAAREFGHKYVEEWNKAVSKAFGDDDDELQKAAQELNASQLVPTKDERDTFKRIELSYHALRFEDAKSFFLLCCMFPEDYDIPIEDLFKYGIGKGLLQYSDTLQEARDKAHSLVADLKALGLLLDGKKGCIRMHFDIQNVAMSIALSEGHAFFVKAGCELKDWPMDAHEVYSAISLMRNRLNKLPETLVCSELQILLLQSNAGICDIPKTFFQSPNALRVFDLSYTGISVLPSSFNVLTNLQALFLDCCNKITDISVLRKLKKVEILSLREFPLKELPKEIGSLNSLRMLDVTGGCVHKIPSKVISRLYRLEELYMKCEFGNWGSTVEEAVGQTIAGFDEIIGLSRLNILKVYISDAACLPKDIGFFGPNWVKFDICISRDLSPEMMLSPNDQPSRTLTLDRTINGLSDWFINVVTEKAEKLEYRECKGLTNILKEYEHGRLHGLKHLSIIGCPENWEELINAATWDPSKPVFESLEKLHPLQLQLLKELCVGELPLGSLCNLKLLKVQTCCNLMNALLPPKLLQRLTNLETIFCINMEHMKYVFGSEGLEPGMILLTKLSEMRLCALFRLISIWNGPAPNAVFYNLKVLAVCKCTKLKSLFPFDVARSLVQLEDLSVEHCPSLGRVIEASNSLNTSIGFLALKKLVLINLPELTGFCTEDGTVDTECPSLEYLYLDKCPQFINSASASVKLNDQQHLNSLVKRWEDMYNL